MNETNKKLEILSQFGLNENQVGSEMAQVLFSCLRIESLTLHLKPIQLFESDLESMTQKGRNIITSAYLGTGNRKDSSAVRAIKKINSNIKIKLNYIQRNRKNEYNDFFQKLRERFSFIRSSKS